MTIRLPFALLALGALLAGCGSSSDETELPGDRSGRAAPTESVAGVELYALPKPVALSCRQAGKGAPAPLLCPTSLPRPSRALDSSAFISYPLSVAPLAGPDGAVRGFDFSYEGDSGRPSLDGPEHFLHFDVQVRKPNDPLPPRTFSTTLGGRRGLLAPATSRNYAVEPYFANHVRFFWRENGTRYAATLHNFGPKTKTVLGAIVRGLRPARDVTPSATSASGVDVIRVPIAGPSTVAVNSDGVWIAGTGALGTDQGEQTALVQLDPESSKLISGPRQISRYPGLPTALATSGGRLWLGQFGFLHQPDVLRLREDGSGFAKYFTTGMNVADLAVTDGTIWALDHGKYPAVSQSSGPAIERLDWRSGRTVARVRVGRAPAELALGAGSVWATNNLDGTVSRVDVQTTRPSKPIRVGVAPVGIAVGYGGVWVANSGGGTLSRIDPTRGLVVETIKVGQGPRGVAVGEGSVWVSNYLDDTVSRVDPATGRVTETIAVGAGPTGIAAGHGAIWVADLLDQEVSRIEP